MRELLNKRDEYMRVHQDDEGNEIISLYPMPIHYKDEADEWSLVDTGIYENVLSNPQVYKFTTRANSFVIGFKERANSPKFVDFKNGRGAKGSISYTLNGLYYYEPLNENKVLIAQPNPAVASTVELNKLVYTGVFDGVDIEFISGAYGLKENVILHEEVKSWLPDPISLGFDPSTVKLILSVTIDSKHGHEKTDRIGFKGSDGTAQNWLAPVVASSATGRNLPTVEEFDEQSKEYLYGINYRGTQLASYPIIIDPTLYINRNNYDEGFIRVYSGTPSTYTAFSTTGQTTSDAGMQWSDDGKGSTSWYKNREFTRFYIETYQNHTIYGTCTWSMRTTSVGARQLRLEEITDWYSILNGNADCQTDWNRAVLFDCGIVPQTYATFTPAPNSIKNRLIIAKSTVPPSPENSSKRVIAFRLRANSEADGAPSTNESPSQISVSSTFAPKLDFSSYDTFTQNAPTAGAGQVTVNWTNGGGLVSGDKHRIYYKAGTGLDAATIIANNTYVETTAYTDTSKIVTGLTNGTAYCFVVVDVQMVSAVAYEGARSSIQSATPAAGGNPGPVTVYCDSKRNARNIVAPQADTKRKNRNVLAVLADTYRTAKNVVAVLTDSFRKARQTVAINTDSKRAVSNVIAVLTDTARNVISSEVVLVTADTLRKVVNVVAVSTDSKRAVRSVQAVLIASKRAVQNVVAILTDSKRVVQSVQAILTDSRRAVRSVVTVLSDTTRNVINSASVIVNVDTLRKVLNNVIVTSDAKRKVLNIVAVLTDSSRTALKVVAILVDSYRKAQATVAVNADSKRKVQNVVAVLTDTLREVTYLLVVHIQADLVRIVKKAVSVQSDTRRKTQNVIAVLTDSKRKVTNAVQVVTDSFRKVILTQDIRADLYRKLSGLVSVQTDTRRKPTVNTTVNADSKRKVVYIVAVLTDAYRKAVKSVSVRSDARRKMSKVVAIVTDTLRRILDDMTRPKKAPGFKLVELPFKYQWKEIDRMKNFKVGEEKEVGFVCSSTDGTDFVITDATYEYRNAAGQVLESGNAIIDEKKVFVLLAPEVAGSGVVEFKVTTQPKNDAGQADPTKNSQKFEPEIQIVVKQ